MKKRNLILAIIVTLIFGIFIGYIISNKINVSDYIPVKEQKKMELDSVYDDTIDNPYDDTIDNEDTLEFYKNLVEELDFLKVYDSSELTLELLINRNENLIIEKCIGEVINSEGNGRVLNGNYDGNFDSEYYYINYSSVEGADTGDIILTYFIYNPDTNYDDDILLRFDYIIDDKN